MRIDPTRIAAQIVTGVGFLGAGAIIRQGLSVRGLTTAAACGSPRRSGWRPAPATGSPRCHDRDRAARALARCASLEGHLVRSGGERGTLEVRARSARAPSGRSSTSGPPGVTIQSIEFETTGDGRRVTGRGRAALEARRHAAAPSCASSPGVEGAKWSRLRPASPRRTSTSCASCAARSGLGARASRGEEFPPEEGETYYENARAKARFGREAGPEDAWVLGEDSGIEVEALGGGPGLKSARWAGGAHVERALEALDGRRGRGAAARATSASSSRSRPQARSFAAPASSRAGSPRAARRRRVRLRPGLRPRRRRADGRRAGQRVEGRELASRPSAARCPEHQSGAWHRTGSGEPRCLFDLDRSTAPRESHQLTSAPKTITFDIR